MEFQSTLPRGERQSVNKGKRDSAEFQSTLPRGERLACKKLISSVTHISIHAPARGATCRIFRVFRNKIISIHAPARGATFSPLVKLFCYTISIHAPARGATEKQKGGEQMSQFQSTLPRGERHGVATAESTTYIFQSTLPRGERRLTMENVINLGDISIHAPARGATFFPRLVGCTFLISIHAPARGATDYIRQVGHLPENFNPRSREGSDCMPYILLHHFQIFQSTLPRGERRG